MQNYLKSLSLALLTACSLLLSHHLSAQPIKVEFNKKIIYTDSLNLPGQTSINMVLTMMSELLQRPGVVIYSNYDIQVDGMSVSDASEVALYQLSIDDVVQIEIIESPTASYQKNGQGGIINLILRQNDNNGDGIWGSAGVDFSYPATVSPQVHLGYRTKKFSIAGVVLSDIANLTNSNENLTYVDGKLDQLTTSGYSELWRSQLANLMMEYCPTQKDRIKLSFSESVVYEKQTDTPGYDKEKAIIDKTNMTNLNAKLSYIHDFLRSTFKMETQFGYVPSTQWHLTPDVQDLEADVNNYVLAGMMEYYAHLLKPENPNKLKVGLGNSFNYTYGDNGVFFTQYYDVSKTRQSIETDNHTSFTQPFAYVESSVGKFRMKLQGEYQIYRNELSNKDNDFKATTRNFTWQLMTEWHFRQNQTLRLFAARALQRPTSSQMYPFSIFNPSDNVYVKGNEDLSPTMTHEVRLDYIADLHWGEHKLHYDVNTSYKHVSDMIMQATLGGENQGGGLGMTQHHVTYLNEGKNDILSGNVMALYSYKAFAISLAGNVFHNNQTLLSSPDHYTYYNLSINPHFNLKDGWQGSFGLTYNSSVKTEYSTLSDCSQATTAIGKRWKNLFVYCMTSVTLQKYATNTSWNDNTRKEQRYELASDLAAIGVKYLF